MKTRSIATTPEVLFLSKPVEAPWNDGSKTIARDLASAMTHFSPVVLGTFGGCAHAGRGRALQCLSDRSRHSLTRGDALLSLSVGLLEPHSSLVHFFFQPNRRTSAAARMLCRIRRDRPALHTVTTAPGLVAQDVFFADRTVVLSRSTESRLLAANVPGVVRIGPPVRPPEVPDVDVRHVFDLPRDEPLMVFPGDIERDGAALAVRVLPRLAGAHLVLAYRSKSPATRAAEATLRALTIELGVADRAHFVGETPHILSLLAACDVVLFPSTDLGAKVDLPISLIEAMWLGRPVLVSERASASELAREGGALALGDQEEAWVFQIARLLQDSEARIRLGASARHAAEEFEPAAIAKQYEALYADLLSNV